MRPLLPLLALALATPAAAAPDCGALPRGKNPTWPDLDREIARIAAKHKVPTEIIKAIAWRESGCQQWKPDGSLVHNAKDCGLGMMQLTGATAKQFDVERLKSDWRYNLECGVTVLVQKWMRAQQRQQVGAEPEARRVLENWYYPVAYYWGGQTEDYLKKVFDHLDKRPGALRVLLRRGVKVTLASQAIPGFKFGDRFRAFPEGRFEDAQGRAHRAPTHLGTLGDPGTLAALETWLARGRAAAQKGQEEAALKNLLAVVRAGADTDHEVEARKLLEPFAERARQELATARAQHGLGEARGLAAMRRLAKRWKGHPVGEEAERAAQEAAARRP